MRCLLSRVAGLMFVGLWGCGGEFAADDARVRITFHVAVDESVGDRDAVLESVRQTIETRLSAAEVVSEFRVQVSGDGEIDVLTGEITEQQIVEIQRLASRPGSLEFALLANARDHAAQIAAATTDAEPANPEETAEWVVVGADVDGEVREIGLHGEVVFREAADGETARAAFLVIRGPAEERITGADLQSTSVGVDPAGNGALGFQLSDQGDARMRAVTAAASPAADGFKRRLAIILDGEIHSAPSINEMIGGRGQITGGFEEDEIPELVIVLSAGELAARVELVEVTWRGEGAD